MLYAVVDLETTGPIPQKDKIIDIAVVLFDGKKIIQQFSTLVQPQIPIPPIIQELTGIQEHMVKNAPLFEQIAQEVLKLTQNTIFVAHNAHFDYSFLKYHLKNLGYHFRRKTLCTVRLSRKAFPEIQAYSLDALANYLQIPIQQRHRALGDSLITVKILEHILQQLNQTTLENELHYGLKPHHLPPSLTMDEIHSLPDEAGVYYFHDKNQQILYIGSAKNIHKRVSQQLQNQQNPPQLTLQIAKITYDLTGNELLANVWKLHQIQKYQPPFNHFPPKRKYKYGIFRHKTPQGYYALFLQKLSASTPLLPTTHFREGQNILQNLLKRYNLCANLCSTQPPPPKPKSCLNLPLNLCQGACVGKEPPESYNSRVEQALCHLSYPCPSFYIIGEGRKGKEKSVISVQNRHYQGFGYLNFEPSRENIPQIQQAVIPQPENLHIQKILLEYLKKKKNPPILPLE